MNTNSNSCDVYKFVVEYAKSGKSKCKFCNKKIENGLIRFGRQATFKGKYINQFFHLECAFKSFARARVQSNVVTSTDGIKGLEDLTDVDKVRVVNMINSYTSLAQNLALPSNNTCKSTPTLHPPRVQKARKISSSIPKMKVMYTNADQMTSTKFMELKAKVRLYNPTIIAVCEVNLKNGKQRSIQEYHIPGYVLYPVNLNEEKHRGIVVLVREELSNSVLQIEPSVNFEEACVLEIMLRGGNTLIFCCCYRSPTRTNVSDGNNNKLLQLIKSLSSVKRYTHLCVVGDFNMKQIDWKMWNCDNDDESFENQFLECLDECFLFQHIEHTTRQRGSDRPSVLDLVLTNEEHQISEIVYESPLGKSDHSTLVFDYHCYLDFSIPKGRYNFCKGDYAGMLSDSSISEWADITSFSETSSCVEETWQRIKTKILQLRNKYVPFTKPMSMDKWKSKGCVPLAKEVRESIRTKRKQHRLWIASLGSANEDTARLAYVKSRNNAQCHLRKNKRQFEKRIAQSAKTQPRLFWAHTRRKLNTKTGIAPLLNHGNKQNPIAYTDIDKANALQRQFSSVFTDEHGETLPEFPPRTNQTVINIEITNDMVHEFLSKLNTSKSCGPDELHPRILKELKDVISKPIANLLNLSIKQGVVPIDWKLAMITPIFKKGAKNLPENYRPISLTAVLCKMLETFIRRAILEHLKTNKLLSPRQFGFISGRSTLTQLLYYFDTALKDIADGKVVDTIYFDFEKAFDTVPHKRLVHKLTSYGINGKLLEWIENYLTGRKQTVVVNGEQSDEAPVLSGIPQGTVLGPLLFVIYINDLLDNVRSNGLLFADDTKIFRAITCKEDSISLQQDIDMMQDWTDNWLLKFHPGKCHVLTLGRFENIAIAYRYKIRNQEIEHVFCERDLGVHVDSEFSFDEHIAIKTRLANAILGQIRRSFCYLDGKTFTKLYASFVRHHLEYNQSAWAPARKKHINMIERVQERGTKLVDGFKNLSYEERLRKLNLTTLAFRRLRGDMIELYKHIHVYDRETISDTFRLRERVTRKHRFQVLERTPSDGARGPQSKSFYYRSIREWNDLPEDVVMASSVNEFKNRLDSNWKSHRLKYEIN